ncbi:uncharacterized protein J3D65DRAFT_52055 [Phyllosticta citribraziliensis]|uniref:Uncharacterized protein n=1 Tax=Phyllosticta citribraziliensis TaxID=989973 RepID=A0ABR1LC25_9PEZI
MKFVAGISARDVSTEAIGLMTRPARQLLLPDSPPRRPLGRTKPKDETRQAYRTMSLSIWRRHTCRSKRLQNSIQSTPTCSGSAMKSSAGPSPAEALETVRSPIWSGLHLSWLGVSRRLFVLTTAKTARPRLVELMVFDGKTRAQSDGLYRRHGERQDYIARILSTQGVCISPLSLMAHHADARHLWHVRSVPTTNRRPTCSSVVHADTLNSSQFELDCIADERSRDAWPP